MQNMHCIEPLFSLIAPAALNFSGRHAEVFDPILKVVSAGLAGCRMAMAMATNRNHTRTGPVSGWR